MTTSFKRRKVWHFMSPDRITESWWGDCPKWAAAMMVSRPDLREVVGIKIGPKSHCSACAMGFRH